MSYLSVFKRSPLGVTKSLLHAQMVSFRGKIQNFRRVSPSVSYGSPPRDSRFYKAFLSTMWRNFTLWLWIVARILAWIIHLNHRYHSLLRIIFDKSHSCQSSSKTPSSKVEGICKHSEKVRRTRRITGLCILGDPSAVSWVGRYVAFSKAGTKGLVIIYRLGGGGGGFGAKQGEI